MATKGMKNILDALKEQGFTISVYTPLSGPMNDVKYEIEKDGKKVLIKETKLY